MLSSKKAVIAGRKAKANGEHFENIFQWSARKFGAAVIKIPSGCRWVSGTRAMPVQTPFDFIVCYNSKAITVDTKTIESGNFTKSMVKIHQVSQMLPIERQKIHAGYVVWFREQNKVVFFKASQLIDLKRWCSLKIDDGIGVGSAQQINFEVLFNE